MLLTLVGFIAVMLTFVMFHSKNSMLGYACAIFWVLTGAQALTLSISPWGDIYYFLFFACAFGMTLFSILAAFGLREKKETMADEEMDEDAEPEDKEDGEFLDEKREPSDRTARLRARADKRRERLSGKGRG